MKKLVLVLAIALIAAPSFGAVTMTLTQVGTTNVYNVNYATSDANLPRAFALTVQVAGGGKISAVSGFKTGVSTAASKGYGIFPGTIDINSVTGVPASYGTPVAPATDPGAAGSGIGTSKVVLELGSLYAGDANKPATSGVLCTVAIDCNGKTVNQTLSAALESTYRGGVVMENGAQPAVTIASVTYTGCAPTDCMKTTASGYPAGPAGQGYVNWVAAGKPACWCYQYQQLGDIDGKEEGTGLGIKRIGAVDLGIFKTNYGKKRAVLNGTSGICADIDHLDEGTGLGIKAVGAVDLAIFKTNYGKKTGALSSAPYAGDYNFWTVAP